jgi:uncharacterized phage infection (PIP) family protein YhgE
MSEQPSGLTDTQLVAQLTARYTGQEAAQADPEPPAAPPVDEAPAEEPEQSADQAPESDEPTLDDFDEPVQPEQSAPDKFEIEWNGEKKVLGRDEVKELAQKGFDYTRKTQQLGEERTRLQMMVQAVQQTAALQSALVEDVGDAKAIQRELSRFPSTPDEWMKLSQDDPLGAFQTRTRYDALLQQYNGTVQQIQQKAAQLRQGQGQISAEQLRAEFAKAQEKVPAWKDPEAFKKDSQGIRSFLLSEGYGEQEVDALADARALGVAWKAWKYDQLAKAKSDRLKQVRAAPPPAVRPGSATNANSANRAKEVEATQRLKKTGDLHDAAAVLLNRMRKR